MPAKLLLLLLITALAQGCAAQRARSGRFWNYAPYRFSGPAPEAQCSAAGRWKYCVDIPPAGTAQDPSTVLYILHHAGGSERTWSEFPVARKFYAEFAERRLRAPRVVSVSYGPHWTLMETAGETQPALLGSFVEELLPAIERDFPRPIKRWVWGTSQGAFNAASLILRRPELFERAVLSCPAIYSFALYSDDEADAYTRRLNARRASVYWGLDVLRPRVGGPEAWEREGPLALVAGASVLPPTLMQVNGRDEFGFHEGGKLFAAAARARGLPVVLDSNGGGHCVIDAERAIGFLAGSGGERAGF